MAWLSDLAGRAETLLNNLDEHAGVTLRNHKLKAKKNDQEDVSPQKRKPIKPLRKLTSKDEKHYSLSITEQGKVKALVKRKPGYSMNKCPKTMVGDSSGDDVCKPRRNSLPSDLELIEDIYKTQNVVIENSMLKNELRTMNGEVSKLMDRLRKAEDELSKQFILNTNVREKERKIENKSTQNNANATRVLKEQNLAEVNRYRQLVEEKQNEISLLRKAIKDLEHRLSEQQKKCRQSEAACAKSEGDARHAQTLNQELRANMERSKADCARLERDWEGYKLRVKNMLLNKDLKIKELQEGLYVTEDAKVLMEQVENFKQEHERLTEELQKLRSTLEQTELSKGKLEERYTAAERLAVALRDTLRDERVAKNALHEEFVKINKELTTQQLVSNRQISALRTELKNKEIEIESYRETSRSLLSANTSAFNVADYDDNHEEQSKAKIEYLTETLVQRQEKIDQLIADNNILRIQMEKLESKYRNEIASLRVKNNDSIVHLHDTDGKCRSRSKLGEPVSCLRRMSVKIGVMIRRYPIIRMIIFFYMISLHLWVFTVLLSSTPSYNQDYYGQKALTKNTMKQISED